MRPTIPSIPSRSGQTPERAPRSGSVGAQVPGRVVPVTPPRADGAAPGDAGAGDAGATDVQPTLRVMRLYKPSLHATQPLPYCAHADALARGGTRGCLLDAASAAGGGAAGVNDEFSLSSCLRLPDSFGSIYRGEAFCAYISVLNHHETRPLLRVAISAKL